MDRDQSKCGESLHRVCFEDGSPQGDAPDVGNRNPPRAEAGASKLDFIVGKTYVEVKTPLQQLQVDIPPYVKTKRVAPFSSTDRFVRHITELANSLEESEKAILIVCCLYDNEGFEVIERSTNYVSVKQVVDSALARGVEMWQVNFCLTPTEVYLDRYCRLYCSAGAHFPQSSSHHP